MLLRKAFFAFLTFNLCILIQLTASEYCSKLEDTNSVLLANRTRFLSIADGAEKFGLELFTLVSNEAYDNDFIISPFSVWALLLLLVEAAADNTLQELNAVLRLKEDRLVLRQAFNVVQQFLLRKTPTIHVENLQAMYYDTYEKFDADYIRTLTTCYTAKVQNLNFTDTRASLNFINNAINTETKGLIKDALTVDDVYNARILLTSTLYFKGQWQFPFNRSETRKEPFYDMNGKPIGEVEMMFQMTAFNYTRMVDLQAHVLELPYGNENRLCMLAILPNKGISVNQVVHSLQKTGVRAIFSKLEEDALGFGEQEVEVYLPRFETSTTVPLRGVLDAMGLKSIFDPQTVNLSVLSKSLFVKDVMQSTKIIVNEEGTEAAALAAAILANKISPPKFYFNRPFLYLIAEKRSNMLLFAGQISSPDLSQKRN